MKFAPYLLSLITLASSALAYTPTEKISREWKSADGRALAAELIEYDGVEVRLKRASDFQIVKVPLGSLGAEDRKFILAMVQERKLDTSLTEGKFAASMTGSFTKLTSGRGLNFQLYGNPKWEGTKRYPLVIWLHGSGQSGTDNEAQMSGATGVFTKAENQEKNPCFVMAPQCPDSAIGWNKEVAANLMAAIGELVMGLPIDQKRLYLTGSSMGGFGTFGLVMDHPGIFAAAVPLCGGSDVKNADKLLATPIWAFHGDKDDMVPVERTRNVMKAILAKVGERSRYTELIGEGHGITGSAYGNPELHQWLFARRLGGE
jgi:predicted peptidase